ncbi:hypothetical protein CHARACLAT_008933, partial [Characodon lateralis]|nr:hypothetical protein [Characodon lateralis]
LRVAASGSASSVLKPLHRQLSDSTPLLALNTATPNPNLKRREVAKAAPSPLLQNGTACTYFFTFVLVLNGGLHHPERLSPSSPTRAAA